MPYRSLADFLEQLEQEGQLARVAVEVDPMLEIAEITRRVSRAGGPALLFQNVKGHHTAVVTNLLGTEARIQRALGGRPPAEVAAGIEGLLCSSRSQSWVERLKPGGQQSSAERWQPKLVKTAACQQVVKLGSDVDLGDLPLLQSWPEEAGRSLSAPVFTRHAETEERSVGGHALQLLDRNRLLIAWHPQQRVAKHFESYRRKGERMPVAVVVGGDPAWAIAVGGPLTAEFDGCLLAGLLRDQPLELVKCRTVDLRVPADADTVIEGHIDSTAQPASAGPLAMDTGYYGLPRPAHVLNVTAITERTNPLFLSVIGEDRGGEAWTIHRVVERLMLPLVTMTIPELADYRLPGTGGLHGFAFLSIRKSYAQQARKVASAVWGWEPLMFAKVVVIVDEDCDLHDEAQVWARVAANVHPGRDVFFHHGPTSPADHASPVYMLGQAMAIDATSKLPEEHPRPWPGRLKPGQDVQDLVASRWREYGLASSGD